MEMEMIQHKCKNCAGALIEQPNGLWKCRNCGSEFDIQTVEKQTKQLQEMFDEQVRERIYNLRRNLYDALHATNISSTEVYNACVALKQYLPDDFQANFYAVASGSNIKELTCAIRKIDVEANADEIEGVVQYLTRSLQNEFLLDLKNLVEKAWRKKDLKKFERYSTEIEQEAVKVQAGVYETKLPREVFVAYSSKDMDKVTTLVEELESQGIHCFVAARNLRHGRGAVENYNGALEEAMDHCRVFVFVSSENSRSLDCDALKLEIPYIQKKDIKNAPAEYRNNYASIPQQYKKPRVEYRIKDSRHKTAADTMTGEFFDGYEHAYSPREVADRVMKQLLYSGTPAEAQPQKKFCSSCGEENAPDARFCSKCGGTSFVASIAEFIRQTNASQEAEKEETLKKLREAEKEAERQRQAAKKAAQEAAAAMNRTEAVGSVYRAPSSSGSKKNYSSGKKKGGCGRFFLITVLLLVGVAIISVLVDSFSTVEPEPMTEPIIMTDVITYPSFSEDMYDEDMNGPSSPAVELESEVPMEFPAFTPEEEELVLVDMLAQAREFDGNYYMVINTYATWEQAQAYCETMGGHLAVLTNQAEMDFCKDLIREQYSDGYYFVGGTDADTEGIWQWITGEKWNLSYWQPGSPDGGTYENVAGFNVWETNFVDMDGNSTAPFICEWEEENVPDITGKYGYLTSAGMIFNDAFYYSGSVYKYFNYSMSYDEALEYCQKLGGHLATVTSEDENRILSAYLVSNGAGTCFLGATDEVSEGHWKWCTGESFSWEFFEEASPDGDTYENYLAHTAWVTGEWVDINDEYGYSFVCEWDNCQFDEDRIVHPAEIEMGSEFSPLANAEDVYTAAKEKMYKGEYFAALSLFEIVSDYKRSEALSVFCLEHSGLRYEIGGVDGGYVVYGYDGNETKLVIPASCGDIPFTEIAIDAFDSSFIQEIVIGSNIRKIGDTAFCYCYSLEKVTFASDEQSIEFGRQVFFYCSALKEITLPAGVETMTEYMFYGCSSLETLTIPDSVTSIEEMVIYDCYNLTDIYYQGTEDQWGRISKYEDIPYGITLHFLGGRSDEAEVEIIIP